MLSAVESYVPSYRLLAGGVYHPRSLMGMDGWADSGALSLGLPESANTTPHAGSSSMKSGGALLTTGRLRPWLRWKRSDW